MDIRRILGFLEAIRENNNREWFLENKKEYQAVRKIFEKDVEKLIERISLFDASISHITVKDATYRFNRDTRFSLDKSPYKRHFGAYIAAHGKKAFHGGYYIHVEPGNCFVACGNYYLPTNILTSCRNEIMANIDDWRNVVESAAFVKFFGRAGQSCWGDKKGFGGEYLKKSPSGFPRDYEFIDYLRMKDYCCWKALPDTFYDGEAWFDEVVKIFKVAKPMMDFVNSVIDDYE